MPTQIGILKKYGLQIRGAMGQHLLIDPNMQRKIVDLLSVRPRDKILEIGPGLGALTAEILSRGASVITVEKEKRFIPILTEELAPYGKKFKIVCADILGTDFKKLLGSGRGKWKVISNLPYYITAPLLLKLAGARKLFSEAVLTMQKEVAQRLEAFPGTKHYGRLTLAVRYAADVEPGFDIPKTCFTPVPEVDSSVLRLVFHKGPSLLPGADEKFLFDLIRIAFGQRRKTFLRVLNRDSQICLGRDELLNIFKSIGFAETIRGEELLLKDFLTLAAKFKRHVHER